MYEVPIPIIFLGFPTASDDRFRVFRHIKLYDPPANSTDVLTLNSKILNLCAYLIWCY